jgi:hypothetical protein
MPVHAKLDGLQVSPEDQDLIDAYSWYAKDSTDKYACAWIDGRNQYLHRIIAGRMGLNLQGQIDHHNGDKLDNRRSNLRAASHGQNQHNVGLQSNNTTGFKGVSFHKRIGKYQALIRFHGKRHHLGYHGTAEQAARAYDDAAREKFGEFARLNFPLEGERSAREVTA